MFKKIRKKKTKHLQPIRKDLSRKAAKQDAKEVQKLIQNTLLNQ